MERDGSYIVETAWRLLWLLLALSATSARANPVEVQDCIQKPVGKGIQVSYTTSRIASGCLGRGATEAGLEVHVLSLKFSDSPVVVELHLNTLAVKDKTRHGWKTVFVVSSEAAILVHADVKDLPVTYITNSPFVYGPGVNVITNKTELPASAEELLKWAKERYGDVSSFAVLENPQSIYFQVGRELSRPQDCILEMNFNAGQYLETEVAAHKIESCLGPSGNTSREAHIVWLRQGSDTQVVDVILNITCSSEEPNRLLMLKSQERTVWNIDVAEFVSVLVSGTFSFKGTPVQDVPGETLPETKADLIKEAQSKRYDYIASYTEIPSAKRITLDLCETRVLSPTMPAVTQNSRSEKISLQTLIATFPPWKCKDDAIEVALSKHLIKSLNFSVTSMTLEDPNCVAKDNTTHFVLQSSLKNVHLERGIRIRNKLLVTLNSSPDKIEVPFHCDLPEKAFLQLYHAPDFSPQSATSTVKANQVTYVQVSLRTADERSRLELKGCSLEAPDAEPLELLIHSDDPVDSSMESSTSPPSIKARRFSVTYKAKEGRWLPSSALLACEVYLDLEELRQFNASLEVKLEYRSPPPHSRISTLCHSCSSSGSVSMATSWGAACGDRPDLQEDQGLGVGTVLGITFGAFFIGVLLTAALWYIYSHTRPMAKMQPVSTNLPASESSSSNHSIGSTQSTPCSTSSTA